MAGEEIGADLHLSNSICFPTCAAVWRPALTARLPLPSDPGCDVLDVRSLAIQVSSLPDTQYNRRVQCSFQVSEHHIMRTNLKVRWLLLLCLFIVSCKHITLVSLALGGPLTPCGHHGDEWLLHGILPAVIPRLKCAMPSERISGDRAAPPRDPQVVMLIGNRCYNPKLPAYYDPRAVAEQQGGLEQHGHLLRTRSRRPATTTSVQKTASRKNTATSIRGGKRAQPKPSSKKEGTSVVQVRQRQPMRMAKSGLICSEEDHILRNELRPNGARVANSNNCCAIGTC